MRSHESWACELLRLAWASTATGKSKRKWPGFDAGETRLRFQVLEPLESRVLCCVLNCGGGFRPSNWIMETSSMALHVLKSRALQLDQLIRLFLKRLGVKNK